MSQSVTVCIPHRDTPDLLRSIVPLWKRQSAPVFLVVVDTGSKNLPIEELRNWTIDGSRAIDLLIHQPRQKAIAHFGDSVAAANQSVQDLCFTDHLIFTHTDVFPQRIDLVESLVQQLQEAAAIGYRMSPRDHCRGFLGKSWRWMVGHSLLAVEMKRFRNSNISWSRLVAEKEFDVQNSTHPDNWDSEVTMNLCLRRAGIVPKILGSESNFQKFEDGNIVHCRSSTLSRLGYHDKNHSENCESWIREETELASRRSNLWRHSSELTIFVPLSGRKWAWPRFSKMLDGLTVPARTSLVFLDTGQDEEFSGMVSSWSGSWAFRDVKHIRLSVGDPGLADQERSGCVNQVQSVMSLIYRYMQMNLRTGFALIIEDDVIPPYDVIPRLMASMIGEACSVSAAYPQKDNDLLFAWDWRGLGFDFLPDSCSGVCQVGGNGFGCVLLTREAIDLGSFQSGVFSDIDLQFYAELREKNQVCLLDGDVCCEHLSP